MYGFYFNILQFKNLLCNIPCVQSMNLGVLQQMVVKLTQFGKNSVSTL